MAPRLVAADEAEDDARRAIPGRVVEGYVGGPLVGDGGSVKARVAPERPVVDRRHLDQRPLGQPLGELVSLRGKPRAVFDPAGERGRDGDDRPLGLHLEPRGVGGYVAPLLDDPLHRRAEQDAAPKPACDPQRQQLGPARQTPHLGAVAGVEVALEGAGVLLIARGRDVEEHEQKRQIPRLAAEDRPRCHRDEVAELLRLAVVANPGLERLPVPVRRVGGCPRGVDRHLGRHLVEAQYGLGQLAEDQWVGWRSPERPGVAVRASPSTGVDVDVLAVVEGGELADPELLCEGEDVVLGGADERGAALGDLAPADRLVEGPAADPVAGLQDDHRAPRLDQPQGGCEAGEAGADHDHVGAEARGTGGVGIRGSPQHRPQARGGRGAEKAATADRVVGHRWRPGSTPYRNGRNRRDGSSVGVADLAAPPCKHAADARGR